jgi:hypothetical protein
MGDELSVFWLLNAEIASRIVWFGGARAGIPQVTFSSKFAVPTSSTVLVLIVVMLSSARLAMIFAGSPASFDFALLKKVVLGDQRSRTTLRVMVERTRFPFWRKSGFPPCETSAGSTRGGRYKTDAPIHRLKARPVGILWVDETGQMKDDTDL